MRFFQALSYALPLASAAVLPLHERSVSYDGYKVFRVTTGDALASVQERLATLQIESWNHDVAQHLDVVISPDQLGAFQSLGLNVTVMHEDLGADIAAESAVEDSTGMPVECHQ